MFTVHKSTKKVLSRYSQAITSTRVVWTVRRFGDKKPVASCDYQANAEMIQDALSLRPIRADQILTLRKALQGLVGESDPEKLKAIGIHISQNPQIPEEEKGTLMAGIQALIETE